MNEINEEVFVSIRRNWNSWKTAKVQIKDLHSFRIEVYGTKSLPYKMPRPFLCANILCTALGEQEFDHSCLHGPAPHDIRITIVKCDNDKKVYAYMKAKI